MRTLDGRRRPAHDATSAREALPVSNELDIRPVTFRYHPTSMEHSAKSKRLLVIGLALAIALDTAGQLVWKIGIGSLPATSDLRPIALAVLHQPLFLVLAAIFLLQLFNWLKVLERAELSYAQPITSLSYVTVCALSAALLGEHIGLAKTLGVVCVLCGVALVSRSGSHERGAADMRP